MILCDYFKPIMWWSFSYLLYSLFMAGGTVMMPGSSSEQFSKSRTALVESWAKARAGTWQSPIFAASFPILLLGLLPMSFPFIAIVISGGIFMLSLWPQC
jgi:hypothetical protein